MAAGAILAATAAVFVLSFLRFGLLPYPNPKYAAGDHYRYIAMALHPMSAGTLAHEAPYCWRIFTPWLAHVFPGGFRVGFYVINFVGCAGCGWFLYAWLRELGIDASRALLAATGFFVVYFGPWFIAYDYFNTDGIGLFTVACALYLIWKEELRWLAILFALGVANKEATLFLLPVMAVHQWRHYGVSAAVVRVAVVGVFPLCTYVLLHTFIARTNAYSVLYLLRTLPGLTNPLSATHPRIGLTVVADIWTFTLGVFGLLLAPVLVFWRRADYRHDAWIALMPYIACITISAAMVTNPPRALVYAFPAVALLFACSVQRLSIPVVVGVITLQGLLTASGLVVSMHTSIPAIGAATVCVVYLVRRELLRPVPRTRIMMPST